MEDRAPYTEYHPRWHRPRVSTYWWLTRWPYAKFVLREVSSIFVAWYVVVILLEVRALAEGPFALARFQIWLQSPLIVALNAVSFLFILYHSITWLNLAPRAMAVRFGGQRVPDWLIVGGNYAALAGISGMIAWLLLGARS